MSNPPLPPSPPGKTIPEAPAHLASVPAAPASPPGPVVRRRWPWFVAAGLVVVVVASVVAWGPMTRAIAVRQARAHGVILGDEIGAVEVGWGLVTLRDFTFELRDVEGVSGSGKEVIVELDGLTAAAMEAHDVELDLVGSAPLLAVAISEWTGAYPELVRIPTKAEEVSVSWRESAGGAVWLTLRGATVEPLKRGAKLEGRASVLGVPVGGVGAVWKGDAAKAQLGFGRSDTEDAPITIDIEDLKSKPKANIVLRPTSLVKLAGPLGMLLPVAGVTVSGSATLRYQGKGKAPIDGEIELLLDGYRPPMPREAQGFDFGTTTTMAAKLAISGDRETVELADVKVSHGQIHLAGSGTITRDKSHAELSMKLNGSVSCVALAKAAVKGGLGGQFGPLIERLAAGGVKGSVTLGLDIEADTRNLLNAKIGRRMGVGCGVQWPTLPELPKGFPEIPKIPGLPF